ncbi:PP2C family protein-serine/threonine phosphatase [Streptomyces sp. NPDC060194]|uniref:PP2C family protein-serine/threonine phosphatase n=1 Tax=Streptomyces sp. NPDC060194 TaxID=3347069 RepID=UPI003654710C
MTEPPAADCVRSRLGLHAIEELLDAQRRRVAASAALHEDEPRADRAGPPPSATGTAPTGQDVLDAIPVAAVLLTPVFGADGVIEDAVYTQRNIAARRYGESRFPAGAVPPWRGPESLFARFPALARTGVLDMLTRAFHERAPQGPETLEWLLPTADGPVRISDESRITPCGEQFLLTWERGSSVRMAAAAQRLVRTCWAEWNLGDDGVACSRGFRDVLGLADGAPVPGLARLAGAITPDSLPELYRLLYDVVLRKRTAACEVGLRGSGERVLRVVAEPVRIAPADVVWALRAVLIDVTSDRRRREAARCAEREAHRQHERAEAVAEVAEALRTAVLPHLHRESVASGLETAAVYRPDARDAGVGGDWYKARDLPGGDLLVALGDARGHGLEATTLMAKLRYALAGLSYTGEPVERLTAWLNEVACADGDESTATAVVASFDPVRSSLRWTCAGHPRPVLLRGGRATQLPLADGGPGLPLGVLSGADYAAAVAPLHVGDIVLLYSDGLTERRDGDPDQDTDRLLGAVARSVRESGPGPGVAGLQDWIERLVTLMDGPHRSDDVTLLALRRVAVHPTR